MGSFSAYLLDQVDRAIYVRGAQGENVLTRPAMPRIPPNMTQTPSALSHYTVPVWQRA